MSYFPLNAVAKTLLTQVSQTNMRQTGLGISASADSILDDASTDAILATLGGGTTGIAVFKDETAADARSDIGSGVAYTVQSKTSNFTAQSGYLYEIDDSAGNVAVTMFTIANSTDFVGFKKVAGSNTITINRDGTQDIDDAASATLTVIGECKELVVRASGNEWMIK